MKKTLFLTTVAFSLFAVPVKQLDETEIRDPRQKDRYLIESESMPYPSQSYPFDPEERRYFTRGEILVLRADIDGSELANHEIISNHVIDNRSEKLNGKWLPGARVGIGYQMDYFDEWNLFLTYTFFHAKSDEKKINATDVYTDFLRQSWIPFLGPQALRAKGHWTIQFNVIDFDISRTTLFSEKIFIRPHIGLRGAFVDLNYLASYTGAWTAITGSTTLLLTQKTHFKGENDFYSGGLRFGSELEWNFACDWSLLCNASASILAGTFDLHQTFAGFDANGTTTLTPVTETFKESMPRLRTNLEATLGIKWEKYFNRSHLRKISLFLGYEFSEWFRLNEMMRVFRSTDIISSTATVSTDNSNFIYQHISGDIGLQGLNAAVLLEF